MATTCALQGQKRPPPNCEPCRSTSDGRPSHSSMATSTNSTSSRCQLQPWLMPVPSTIRPLGMRAEPPDWAAAPRRLASSHELHPERLADDTQGRHRGVTRRRRTVSASRCEDRKKETSYPPAHRAEPPLMDTEPTLHGQHYLPEAASAPGRTLPGRSMPLKHYTRRRSIGRRCRSRRRQTEANGD